MIRVQRGAPPVQANDERLQAIEAKLDAVLELLYQAMHDDQPELEDGERDQTQPL